MFTSTKPDEIILNAGQQDAADGCFDFLLSAAKMMIISGGAGVGKSFLTGYLIDKIIPHYEKTCALMGMNPIYTEVAVTATTNQAAMVTSAAIKRPAQTIQSFLGLIVKNDYASGRSYLARTGASKVHQGKIIIIDESSMVDTDLMRFLDELTFQCKIIFVGDHCQLGPVNEGISPIYSMGLPFYHLTEPVRNAGQPALVKLCQQLRNTVETGIFNPIELVPGVIERFDAAGMEAEIARAFTEQNSGCRILSYTNQRVGDYNTHIRDLRGLGDEYTVGEFLVNNSAFTYGKQRLRVEEQVEVMDQSSLTKFLSIEPGVELEVRNTDLRNSFGQVFSGVPLPVDREHLTNLIKYYGRMKRWERYFYLKENLPDLRPRDAATVHKAQGSTYDAVFVDLENLSTCHQPKTAARLLYVGLSRPRNKVVLYGDLAQKYGGVAC